MNPATCEKPPDQPDGRNLKAFLGAREYEVSRDFYIALGWTLNWEEPEIAELQLGECRFYLQRYYQKHWCNNSMMHLTVNSAEHWFERVSTVLEAKACGDARVNPPKYEDYGAIVTHVWDPSGILWHLAEPDRVE